jgi:hypothetical protein
MKKLILSAVCVVGLIGMSFTTVNSNKVSVIKTSEGLRLTNVDRLSLEDLKTLKDMTIVGMKSVTVAHTKVYKDFVNDSFVSSAEVTLNDNQQEKLNSIIAKY